MNGFFQYGDTSEAVASKIAEIFVVVAGNIDDAGALTGFAQNFLDHIVVRLAPIPSAFHTPAIDDVADQIKVFAFGVL